MKNFKFITLLLAVVGVFAFTSCKEEWAPGAADANLGVYFPDTSAVVVTAEDKSVDIKVARFDASELADVPVRFEDVESTGLFDVEKSVFFEPGKTEATLTISFDGSQLKPGKQYPINIQLDQSQASQYGVSQHIFMIGIAEPWKSLGTGTYRDDFLSPMYGGPAGVIVDVEIVQHELEPNRYRMIEPYSEAMCPYIIGGVPSDMSFTGPGYVEFIVDVATGNVVIPSSPLGFKLDVGTGNGPEDFFLATAYADENTPLYGKFEDGVFWFTTPGSIMWHIPDGRGNFANQSGLFAVGLPGYEIKDYAISAAYTGMVTEADNTTVSAVVDFTVGKDVEYFKFAVLEGLIIDEETIQETINTIVEPAEYNELTIYDSSVDELTWKLQLPNTAVYTLVAVPYSREAEVDDAMSYHFYFNKSADELPEVKFGVYYDSVFNITGQEKYKEQFPESYYVALAILGNPYEMRSIKAWMGDANVAANSGMSAVEIVSNYGSDYSDSISDIRDYYNPETGFGSVVLGPYNMLTGSTSLAIVAIETIYGNTELAVLEKTLPNASGFELGEYVLTDTLVGQDAEGKDVSLDFELPFNLIGGLADGFVTAEIDGFQFRGKVDEEKGLVVFTGYEINDGQDYIFNDVAFYYNAEKTQAFGYYVGDDAEFKKPADLTFSFVDGKFTALNTYFASVVFDLESGEMLGYDFFFSPEANLAFTPAEEAPEQPEQPETSAKRASMRASVPASAESLGVELKYGAKIEASSAKIKAEPYHGEVVREYVSNATLAF